MNSETQTYREAIASIPNCEYHDLIDSTNIRAKELARTGAPQGSAVFAESQTAGRGRLSRTWMSEPGRGIYMSYITRPVNTHAMRSPELSFVAALAVCDAFDSALEQAGSSLRAGIKWPNDVILSDKKACGILAETGLRPDGTIDWAVTGIGLNICGLEFPPELPWATSLQAAGGFDPQRAEIATCLMQRLAFWTQIWLAEGFAPIRSACTARMLTLHKRVRAERDGDSIVGEAIDMAEDGSLLLKTDSGEMLSLHFGEVSVRGMMGYI
ncbi:MAG: biotin--[Clostridia bacterium]|nr:biotin--[acetyl-CoA-carboxylase] ligase [Clostridia bacterium]